MLDGLFLGPAIAAVSETLADRPRGPLAVVGHPVLARGLAERGVEAIAVDAAARPLRKLAVAARGKPDALPLRTRALGTLVGYGAGARADWEDLLAEWSRAVVDGGLLVMVDAARAAATELSRRALCAGLAELRQRPAGRLLVTSGIVTEL